LERELFFSGIGGQGVQLAARTLAVAALRSGLHVLVFGSYGGEMRGGSTDATVVVGRTPLTTPPIVDEAWAALMMHHHGWDKVKPKLRPGALALIDDSVFRGEADHDGPLLEVPATNLASEAGMKRAGSMVALGALVGATDIVSLESLKAAAMEVLPPYRAAFAEANAQALELGYRQIPSPITPAWPVAEAVS
jgi:Pyruvate/2-oxoacid:ferredoxin oxidoreductase gamma subunit